MARDIAAGFVLWCAIFAAAFGMIKAPDLLVWVLRVGLVVAVIYTFYRLFRRGVRAIQHARHIPGEPRIEEVVMLYQFRTGCDPSVAFARVEELLRRFHPAVVGVSVAELGEQDEEEARRHLAERCEELTQQLERLAKQLRSVWRSDIGELERFLACLLMEYRSHEIERAVKRLERQGTEPSRMGVCSALLAELRHVERSSPFASAFQAAEAERTPSLRDLVASLGLGRFGLSVVFPPLAFLFFGQRNRGICLFVAYTALVLYGIVSLLCGNGGGWIFLAVAGMAHFSAVFAIRDLYVQAHMRNR